MTSQREKLAFLHSSSANTPLLKEIEFRTETNQFEIDKQKYSIRFKPIGWGEAASGEKLYALSINSSQVDYDGLLNLSLVNRYQLIVDHIWENTLLDLTQKLQILNKDKIIVLKKSVNHLDFDFNELVDAEDENINLQLDQITQINKIFNIEDEVRRSLPDLSEFHFHSGELIDIRQISNIISEIKATPTTDNVILKNSHLKVQIADAKFEMELAENRDYLSFIKFEYDNEEQEDFDKAISVGFGIRIPFLNPNQLDINRRKLAAIEAKGEFRNLKIKTTDDITILIRALKRLMQQYQVVKGIKERNSVAPSLSLYKKMKGINPLILLKLKESMLKNEMSLAKIIHRIYSKYIELLNVSGKLTEKPLKNYLSNQLVILSP